MDCKISIIVPVYKVERYLENCIESIINQTFKDFELILVDDGSPDRCGLICDNYAKKDERIKVIHKKNEGLSAARNSGIQIAKGEYIAFVDSDDCINKNMYETLYDTAIENKSDIVVCDYKNIYENNEEYENISEKISLIENLTNMEALNRLYELDGVIYVVAWNKLYKRHLFEKFKYDKGRLHEDEFIIHKLLYNSKIITYVPLKLYYYTQRNDSITGKKNIKNKLDVLDAFRERLKFMDKNNLKKLAKKSSKVYIKYFFDTYYDIKNNHKDSKDKLYLLRRDYIKVLYIVLKNIDYNWKEKILLVIFAINPYLYEVYTNKLCNIE